MPQSKTSPNKQKTALSQYLHEIKNLEPLSNEEEVMRLYYGLDGDDPKNLEEIGRIMGLTGERIRQVKKRGLQRLRHSTRSQLLKIYLK